MRRPLHGLAHAVLPRQSWIDRIVRGRAWIPVFGTLLVAIVGMRVEILKLSSRVGTQIQQASALQSSNALLRSAVSELSGTERIEALAERLGMVMPGPMDIHFVSASAGGHLQAAIRGIHAPEPSSFLTGLAEERKADQTNVQTAADTSAVGVLADTVPDYNQTVVNGIATSPLTGAVADGSAAASGTGPNGSTGSAGSTASAALGASESSGTGTATAVPGAAQTSTGAASGNATQSSATPGTVTPSPGAGQAQPTTSGPSTSSGLGTGASDPPTSSATATVAGSQPGSASGGTSLSG